MSAPIAWITDESLLRLSKGGNDSRGSVPVHAASSRVAKTPLYLGEPDTLCALRRLLAMFDSEIHNEYDGTSMLESRLSEANFARDVIAKSEGRA